MLYSLEHGDDPGSNGGTATPDADDQAARNRSLATTVAGFAALAPTPPGAPSQRESADAVSTPGTPATRSSGRIRSALASISATSSPSSEAVDDLQINESYDGIRVLWDITFAGGGGTVVIITPPRKRDPDGDAVPLPAHVSWRGADAIPSCDVLAFASVLMQAAQKAQSLPTAIMPER